MDDGSGFLARWARRKAAARSGGIADEPPAPPAAPATSGAPTTQSAAVAPPAEPRGSVPSATQPASNASTVPAAPAPPPPTLDDVAALTPEADFGRFVGRDVDPGVSNAAMKKLFSDPHYNVMDGLDIYIDDYGKPDPIPKSMLRGLAQSRLLGLFEDEVDNPSDTPRDTTTDHATATAESSAEPDRIHDEDPDLQLQPDDAARAAPGEPGGADPGGHAAGQR